MKPHDIKIEIFKHRPDGLTIASIARDIGVAPQTVDTIITRSRKSMRIARAVAKAIKLPLKTVFPEYVNRRRKSVSG